MAIYYSKCRPLILCLLILPSLFLINQAHSDQTISTMPSKVLLRHFNKLPASITYNLHLVGSTTVISASETQNTKIEQEYLIIENASSSASDAIEVKSYIGEYMHFKINGVEQPRLP